MCCLWPKWSLETPQEVYAKFLRRLQRISHPSHAPTEIRKIMCWRRRSIGEKFGTGQRLSWVQVQDAYSFSAFAPSDAHLKRAAKNMAKKAGGLDGWFWDGLHNLPIKVWTTYESLLKRWFLRASREESNPFPPAWNKIRQVHIPKPGGMCVSVIKLFQVRVCAQFPLEATMWRITAGAMGKESWRPDYAHGGCRKRGVHSAMHCLFEQTCRTRRGYCVTWPGRSFWSNQPWNCYQCSLFR